MEKKVVVSRIPTTHNFWRVAQYYCGCFSPLEYVYGIWWACRGCGKWVARTPVV